MLLLLLSPALLLLSSAQFRLGDDVVKGPPGCEYRTKGGGCLGGYMETLTSGRDFANKRKWVESAPPMLFSSSTCHWPSPKKVALIHVPKAAGTSLITSLSGSPVNMTLVHTASEMQFVPEEFDLFIVLTRDPVDRLISAVNYNVFGWHSMQPNGTNTTFWKVPSELCPDLDAAGAGEWARQLNESGICGDLVRSCTTDAYMDCGISPQIARGAAYFLSTPFGSDHRQTVMSLAGPEVWRSGDDVKPQRRPTFLVRTESIDDDLAGLYEWLCVPEQLRQPAAHANKFDRLGGEPEEVDEAGREIMRQWTLEERQAINMMETLADNGRRKWELGEDSKAVQNVLQP